MQRPASQIDAAFQMLGFMPSDDDVRWPFVERVAAINEQFPFGKMNFDNAWGATYLSAVPSLRSGYITTLNPENRLQLSRALDNLAYRREVLHRFELTDESTGPRVQLRLTDALMSHPGENRTVTPCPEALYQLRLFAGDYIGRVGFNIHREHDASVVSIVNIQGARDSERTIEEFRKKHGISPFNLLVRRVISMARAEGSEAEVRGLANPKRGNSKLYFGVFLSEGVQMYKARHKQIRYIS
jgi:hypothetical protein